MADRQEGTEGQVGGTSADDAAEEAAARRNGWAPREQWRGAADEWMDFKEFNQRGREILPIVAAKNRRLENELGMTQRQLAELQKLAESQGKTIKDLVEHGAEQIARGVEERLKELRADKRAAIREGNYDLAADLEEQIDDTLELREKQRLKAVTSPAPAPTPNAPTVPPWAREFGEANAEWLGPDEVKTAVFTAIADKLMKTTSLRETDLVEEAKRQMQERLGGKPSTTPKSEPGGGGWTGTGGGGNRSGGKTFNDLPPEAKEQCQRQESKFVGESGKAFKKAEDWRKHYADTYFASTNPTR